MIVKRTDTVFVNEILYKILVFSIFTLYNKPRNSMFCQYAHCHGTEAKSENFMKVTSVTAYTGKVILVLSPLRSAEFPCLTCPTLDFLPADKQIFP